MSTPPPSLPPPGATPSPQEEQIEFGRLWGALRRQRWLVLGVAGAVMAAGALFTVLQTPVYRSEATVQINESRPAFGPLGTMLPEGLGALAGLGRGGDNIQTAMMILRSRQVAEAVVDSLGLRVSLLDRERPRDEVLRVLASSRGREEGLFRLRLREDGTYGIERLRGKGRVTLPDRVEIGRPFQVGELTLALNEELRAAPPAQLRFQVAPFYATVESVQKRLRVLRPMSGAQILAVQYRDPDPELVAAVPNVITERFVEYRNRVDKADLRSTIEFLEDQARHYQQDLRLAEARLQGFREQAQIVEPRAQATEQVRRFAELQADRERLNAERESLRRLLTRIEAVPSRPREQSPYRQLAGFPTFLTNGPVQDILQSLIQLENQRAELLVRRTSDNVDVMGINQRIGELELQLFQMARNYLDGIDNQMTSLDALLSRFGGQMELVPSREVEFLRLTREQKLLEEVYTLIQAKLKEAQIEAAAEPMDVQMIDSALVPERPASPRPLLYMLGAMLLGLAAGVSGAFVREYADSRVRSREDVSAATSDLPVLGVIPRAQLRSGNGKGRPALLRNGRVRLLPAHTAAPAVEEHLVTRDDPSDPVAEAYRALRTQVTFFRRNLDSQVLVVTSTGAEEGKSTSASNLAVTLAQQGSSTLLVDADLRRGLLHRLFDVPRTPGLAEVLSGQADLEEAVREVPVGHAGRTLHLLASGTLPPDPAELLGSPTMRAVLERLRERYDSVILDAPPLNLVTDATVLGMVADSVLLVARTGTTEKTALRDATEMLRRLEIPVRGVILNGLEINLERYGPEPGERSRAH